MVNFIDLIAFNHSFWYWYLAIESAMNATNPQAENKDIFFFILISHFVHHNKMAWCKDTSFLFFLSRCNMSIIYLSIDCSILILRISLMGMNSFKFYFKGHSLLLKIKLHFICIVHFTIHILSKQLCWKCVNAIKWFSVVQSGYNLLLVRDECVRVISIWH